MERAVSSSLVLLPKRPFQNRSSMPSVWGSAAPGDLHALHAFQQNTVLQQLRVHGDHPVRVGYARLRPGIGIVQDFSGGAVQFREHKALPGRVPLNPIHGVVPGFNDQERIAVLVMRNGKGLCGTRCAPYVAVLGRLRTCRKDFADTVCARRQVRGPAGLPFAIQWISCQFPQ